MDRKPSSVARLLGGLTIVEGLVTTVATVWMTRAVPEIASAGPTAPPRAALPVAYGLLVVWAVVCISLVVCGWLLLQGDPDGPDALVLALAGEFELFGVMSIVQASLGPDSWLAASLRVGGIAVAVSSTFQYVTAYPLVAAVLLYLVYRRRPPSAGASLWRSPSQPEPPSAVAGRTRVLLRVLAALSAGEVAASLLRIGPSLRLVRSASSLSRFYGYPAAAAAGYASMGLDAVFSVALLCSAALLWRCRPGSLRALAVTLLVEAAYFGPVQSALGLAERGPGEAVSRGLTAALRVGGFSLQMQFLTGFPLIAVALILLADRRARAAVPTESSAAPASATGK